MKGQKVEGEPCVKCGETIRYETGECVNCKSIRNANIKAGNTKHQQASTGIDEPYRRCYEQGFRAKKEDINPYPSSELGKRCAWFAGYNDHH
jgi:hypothetical protein